MDNDNNVRYSIPVNVANKHAVISFRGLDFTLKELMFGVLAIVLAVGLVYVTGKIKTVVYHDPSTVSEYDLARMTINSDGLAVEIKSVVPAVIRLILFLIPIAIYGFLVIQVDGVSVSMLARFRLEFLTGINKYFYRR